MKKINYILLVSIGAGIVALTGLVYIAASRDLSGLESVLLQIISLAIGITGSFFIGRQSAQKAAREIIKPHARSAFRRLLSLYESLRWAMNEIKSAPRSGSPQEYQEALARVEAVITAQLKTADDALEDWRDIVPEDVEELKQRLSSSNTTRDEK